MGNIVHTKLAYLLLPFTDLLDHLTDALLSHIFIFYISLKQD